MDGRARDFAFEEQLHSNTHLAALTGVQVIEGDRLFTTREKDLGQVMDRLAAFVAIEVRTDRIGRDGLVIAKKAIDDDLGIGGVVGGEGDLDTIAGGEDHGFADAGE